jgi:diguanylate cyclase (GGDEF)-like protein
MDQFSPQSWAGIHYSLLFSITAAQVVVIYLLNNSTLPPRALGIYTIYFVAAALCFIAILLQLSAGAVLSIDVAAIVSLVTGYLLVLATAARAEVLAGRLVLGVVCLCAALSAFFLDNHSMFLLESCTIALFCLLITIYSIRNYTHNKNLGDLVLGVTSTFTFFGIAIANYLLFQSGNLYEAKTLLYTLYSCVYALVFVGFLTSVLSDYQQHLVQLATEDPLTRLFNHRGLVEAVNVSLAVAAREGLSTSALMVDIDHFSKVNDNFGEEAGDQVIRQIAGILTRLARASDVIARIGGEEYLLILPDTPLESAHILAERIRAAIDDQPLLVHRQSIHITVSLGIACTTGTVNLDDLTQAADRAMYLAKRGGRNRVASVERKPVHITPTTSRA